jgi:hypothetical protein
LVSGYDIYLFRAIAHILNNSICVPQRYEKWKRCYTSVKDTAHKTLPVGRRITDMPHVDGIDDGAGYGVIGYGRRVGVGGYSDQGVGVEGASGLGRGVYGQSYSHTGVAGRSERGVGVGGNSPYNIGVWGHSQYSRGVEGTSYTGHGVSGYSERGYGLYVSSDSQFAAYLDGKVYIRGPLLKPGGSFKIDHPLDPANKYLYHSFVESPDMKNIYDGVFTLDDKGEAEIDLPDWFSALNKDFRYQLTAIGAPGPNLYIAEEISDGVTNDSNNRFKIAGGTAGMKVSWHVTGIRRDPWANAHRIQIEEDKPDKERGYYIYPDLYGQPAEKRVSPLLFSEEEKELLINEERRPRQRRSGANEELRPAG